MNILLPFSEIKKFLETDASASEFQKYLSLCGPSVEKIIDVDGDSVFDIEVTSNRIDYACLAGIIQEALAILPQFGKKAVLKKNLLLDYRFSQIKFEKANLVKLSRDSLLNPRFTACVLDNIKVKESPSFLQSFLKKTGVRSINNVVDISNYLMFLFGQPVHIFDFDKISKGIMKLRKSQKSEKIKTLDEKEYTLTGGDIVIEDGEGKLIDLCGIMGGKLSEVDQNTKRILLFVQTYNKQNVRQTVMYSGARSIASSYFEKGIDSERVEPTFVYGVKMLEELASARVASALIDEYEISYKPRQIKTDLDFFQKSIGVKIEGEKIKQILDSLGIKTQIQNNEITALVPSWRQNDIFAKEDLVEEVARIYGYTRIPEELPPFVFISDEKIRQVEQQDKLARNIKRQLSAWGFWETYSYSMISEKELAAFNLPKNSLRMNNPISQDLVYFRQSLIPSLVKTWIVNQPFSEFKVYELANIYLPQKTDLPVEQLTLGMLVEGDFFDLKGYLEALFQYSNLEKVTFAETAVYSSLDFAQSEIKAGSSLLGYLGQLNKKCLYEQGISKNLTVAELNFGAFSKLSKDIVLNKNLPDQPFIIEEITFIQSLEINYQDLILQLKKEFPEIFKITFLNKYQNAVSIKIFSLPKNQQSILPKVIEYLEKSLQIRVKH